MRPCLQILLIGGWLVLPVGGAFAAGALTNAAEAATASYDDLLLQAQRFGNTEAKKQSRSLAREALFLRGAEALDYLMSQVHIENDGIQMLISDMVLQKLKGPQAGPVLARYLSDPHDVTRRTAAYYLGNYALPEYAGQVIPLLSDEKTVAAAARTLGKWRAVAAVPALVKLTQDARERRRVVAVNALGDMGAVEAVPALLVALDDPMFTVRKAAARALVRVGEAAVAPVIAALPGASRVKRRELILVLGRLGGETSERALRAELQTEDRLIRQEIALALGTLRSETNAPAGAR